MARGASSTGKGVRRAAPDRQARVGVQEWVWWGSARAGRRRDSGRSHTRPGGSCHAPPLWPISSVSFLSAPPGGEFYR